ncbi:hypothetical protein [Oceanidesulfovibrio indonesiensis]|uniref:hypothetical protein n=1 Tax=Oceanidesulfovibrio indonesiensis TaxID=54767 RepID=UPI0027B961E9|nr:hypothetical protein [Oceanidesulfovibrio indonesiensis]
MVKKVKSVRVPPELEELDLTRLVKECEGYLRDLESASLLKAQGDDEASNALLAARRDDLGRKIARLVLQARARYGLLRHIDKADVEGDATGSAGPAGSTGSGETAPGSSTT